MKSSRRYWLIKTEPEEYSWDTFLSDKSGRWDGVRNYAARNHLRAMKLGDWAFFYHTGKFREVVGVAEVKREAYPDPTAQKGDYSAVDFSPKIQLTQAVPLKKTVADPLCGEMCLVRLPRLSVQPVDESVFYHILSLGRTQVLTDES